MAKNRIDDLRQKLNLDSLDERKKKEMFEKFVKVGGQVVEAEDEEKKKRAKELDEKIAKMRSDDTTYEEVKKARKNRTVKKSMIDLSPESQKSNPINQWIEVFSCRLGCVLSGILTMNAQDLKGNFKDMILMQYQNALLTTRMILASILYQDKFVGNEIKKRFLVDVIYPYYYELIYRFDNLFDDELFSRLGALRQQREIDPETRELLIRVFKGIFVVQPHYQSLKNGVEKALLIEAEIRKLDPGTTTENLKKLNVNIDLVFLKFYPRLYALVDYFHKTDPAAKKKSFKELLKLQDEDYIGFYTNQWKEDLVNMAKQEAEARRKAETEKPKTNASAAAAASGIIQDDTDPIKRGLRIIEGFVRFRDILYYYYEKKDTRAYFPIRDKVFLTYALVDFFDKEFSYIFTSNKVSFGVIFGDGKKLDLKTELSDLHYKLNGIYEKSNEYLKIIKELRKLDEDAYMTIQERSAKSNQFSLQRSQISRTLRKEAKDFFEEFSKKFLVLISDYREEKKIVQNGESLIEFNKNIDGDRYVDGKHVIDAIQDAYCYASALNFLLADGDLSGFSLMLEKPVYLSGQLYQDNADF